MSADLEFQKPIPPKQSYTGWQAALAEFFEFDFYRTNFRTETLAGITTFMTMGYILVVNPIILSNAIFLQQPGDLFSQLAVATARSVTFDPQERKLVSGSEDGGIRLWDSDTGDCLRILTVDRPYEA
jgi:hypothetical protein